MRIEIKLVALSAIAVIVGVASIVPLMFLMTTEAQPFPEDQPQFNIDVPYAYVGDYWNNNSVTANQSYGWVYSLVYRTSPKFDPATMVANATIEYYAAEIFSEDGFIGNVTFATQASQPNPPMTNWSLFYRNQWFTSNASSGSMAVLYSENGTGEGFVNGPGEDWNRTLGKPETLVITVRRLGWIMLSDNSVIAHVATPDVVLEIRLRDYGDGFVHNNIFTEEELSQINPAMPQSRLMGDHPRS